MLICKSLTQGLLNWRLRPDGSTAFRYSLSWRAVHVAWVHRTEQQCKKGWQCRGVPTWRTPSAASSTATTTGWGQRLLYGVSRPPPSPWAAVQPRCMSRAGCAPAAEITLLLFGAFLRANSIWIEQSWVRTAEILTPINPLCLIFMNTTLKIHTPLSLHMYSCALLTPCLTKAVCSRTGKQCGKRCSCAEMAAV